MVVDVSEYHVLIEFVRSVYLTFKSGTSNLFNQIVDISPSCLMGSVFF